MAHKTSWDGTRTRELQKRLGGGVYTRYVNRQKSQGLEVVRPEETYNIILTPTGQVKGFEQKYNHPYGNNQTAASIAKSRMAAYKRKIAQLRKGKK